MFGKYRTAYHKGGLKECLDTEMPITKKYFEILKNNLYEFYAYDERIDANRYIIKDMEHNLGLPQWLHEYINIIEE